MKMTLERARQLLGEEYATLSDEQVRAIMEHTHGLAMFLVEDYTSRLATARSRAANDQQKGAA